MRNGKTRQLSEEEAEEAEFARLQRWDAEIEADFQRAVATTKAAGKAKRGHRLMAAPWAFWVDLCRSLDGYSAAPLVVALLIYRRTIVCKSRSVTLPGADLADLHIDRSQKRRALAKLQTAGLIRVERDGPGRSTKLTLLWQAS
jgi:hypothetical protein